MRCTSLVVTGVTLGIAAGLGAWLLLPAHRLQVTLDLEADAAQLGPGMVYWAESIDRGGWQTFDLDRGRRRYELDLPADFSILQIHPGEVVGPIRLYSVQIDCLGTTLRRFDATTGFRNLQPLSDIDEFALRDDALFMQPSGPAPAFTIVIGEPLGAARQARLLLWAIPIGCLAGLLGAGILWIVGRMRPRPTAEPILSEPLPSAAHPAALPAATGKRWRIAVLSVSTVLSCAAGFAVYHIASQWQAPAPAISTEGFTLSVVNQEGRLLSENPGDVKFLIDPFVGYRNYPNQRSPNFSIDVHGYRGGFDAEDPRPRVMVLGGSAAFGHGLDADDHCLSACLERLDPSRQYVNAAVIGHFSGQELSELVHRGDVVQASVFIVFDGANDFMLQPMPNPVGIDYGYNRAPSFGLAKILLDLHGDSNVPIVPGLQLIDSALHEQKIVEAYTRNLARMAEIASLRGALLLVAFQPSVDCKRKLTAEEVVFSVPEVHAKFVAFLRKARKFCDRNGIAWIDLNDEPRIRDREDRLFNDRVHLNIQGTRLVAEIIMERLRDL